MAREAIKEQLRNEGFRARYALPWEIIERATEYLAQHPEVCREALTRAHLIDEAEGQRRRALTNQENLVQLLRFSAARAY
jgi:hypothetical protein